MMEITAEIRALIDKAAVGMELAGDEYIDPADGLIHCKKCGGQRQTVVPCFGKSGYFMPRCICQCQREAEEQRKAAEERQRRMERIKRRKAQGLQDRYLYDYTFANDNGQNPLMDKARAYVENWKDAYKNNTGLLLFGDVGTGKSFFAGCIANALLDRDVPVLMTNFPTILNRLTGMFSEDRADFIASFDEYDLLIIDDLGVERSTEYAMEQMFFVIDEQVVLVKAGDKVGPVLVEHPRQAVQDGGKVRHQHRHIPVKQGVGDTTGEKGLAGSHIPKQQQAGVVLVSLLPVLHIGAGLVHQGILAVVVGKGVVVQIAVLQSLGLPALDTLHTALPFLSSLALFLGLPLALADTAGHEVARFSEAWHNGLPLAAALLTVNEAVCRVYVLVPGQFHTGGCLVDQRPDFCGNLNHTVSSSFTL